MVDKKYLHSNRLRKSLVMAVCDVSIFKNELDKQELKKKIDILVRYINNSIECELILITALYEFIKISDFPIGNRFFLYLIDIRLKF